MRKTSLKYAIFFGVCVLTISFLACFDAIHIHDQPVNGKAKVSVSFIDNLPRTVFPQVSLGDIALYKLYGGLNDMPEIELAEFTSGGTSIFLQPGLWNFTLNAYNSSGNHVLQGKIENRQISTGTNQISFSLSALNSGIGAIEITAYSSQI
jgi:hypothetical protein